MKRGDILLIIGILVVALVFLVPRWFSDDSSEKNHNESPLVANISVNGKLYKSVELTEEEQTIEVETDHGVNILKVHDHGIEMVEADCPDQLCLSFGFVQRKGGTIICLPHKLLVEIEGGAEKEDDVDVIVQ